MLFETDTIKQLSKAVINFYLEKENTNGMG